LNQIKKWDWVPNSDVKVGNFVAGGDIIGTVTENKLFKAHKIMVPPRYNGKVTKICPAGAYTIMDTMLTCENNG